MPVSEFRPMSEQNPDLDGDGTPDWIYELGAVNTEVEVVVYVRRGQCGHQVLRFLLDSSATPLESVTHGLADLEGRSACRHECCNTWTFDGAKYRLRSTRIEPPAPNCRAAPSARP